MDVGSTGDNAHVSLGVKAGVAGNEEGGVGGGMDKWVLQRHRRSGLV